MKLTKHMTVSEITNAIQNHLNTATYSGVGILKYKNRVSAIQIADTDTISIQASENHYSTPRENTGPYTEVEVGFPSFLFSTWFIEDFAEDVDSPTETVYPYVPLDRLAVELHAYLRK